MHEHYGRRIEQMLDTFDRNVSAFQPALAQRFGSTVSGIMADARAAFLKLLGDLPYIGGDDNPLTPALVTCTESLALFRALQPAGISLREFGQLALTTMAARLEVVPSCAEAREREFAAFCAARRRGALASQLHTCPDDWVYTTRDGDGVTLDFAIDYTECGIVKWFHKMSADELTPYMCQMDYPISRSMDSGLVRTMTLAAGDPMCDFAFKRGRPVAQVINPLHSTG